jgi:hypothetical protein
MDFFPLLLKQKLSSITEHYKMFFVVCVLHTYRWTESKIIIPLPFHSPLVLLPIYLQIFLVNY